MAAKEVNPDQLISGLAGIMKKEGLVNPPQWSMFVKTGAHAQRPPDNPDWWYVRAASVLRQIYMRGPIGVGKLRNWYGGRKNRGAKPERHYKAGGKTIRVCLQQLETAGLVTKESAGRKLTPKGQGLIDKTAASLKPRVEKKPAKKAPTKKAPAKKKKAEPKKETKPKKAPAKKTTKKTPSKKEEKKAEPKPKQEEPAKEKKEE